jgi:hypothetical protein
MRILALSLCLFLSSFSAFAECNFNLESAMHSLKEANSTRKIKRSLQRCSKPTLGRIEQDIKKNLKFMMTNKVEASENRKKQRYQFQANYYLLSLIRNYLDEA